MTKLLITLILVKIFFITQTASAVNIQQLDRGHSLVFDKLEDTRLSNSHVYNDHDLVLTLGSSWVDQPLVFKNPNNNQVDTVIEKMYATHLGASLYLTKIFMVGATTTHSLLWDKDDKKISDFSDIYLISKWKFFENTRSAISVIPQLQIPLKGGGYDIKDPNNPGASLGKDNLLSDNSMGYGLRFAYEYLFSWGQLLGNLGYRYSKDAEFIPNNANNGIDMTHQVFTGLGAYIPILDSIGLNLEWTRQWSFPLFNNDLNPNEFFVGASGALTKTLHAFGGVGFGNLFSSDDGNDYRLSLGLKYAPRVWSEKRKIIVENEPVEPEYNMVESKNVFGDTNIVVIRFENDEDITLLKPEALDYITKQINTWRHKIKTIKVIGHTSTAGSKESNLKLSQRRAQFVATSLEENSVPKELITQIGKGAYQLVTNPEASSLDAATNRRVEVQVILKE